MDCISIPLSLWKGEKCSSCRQQIFAFKKNWIFLSYFISFYVETSNPWDVIIIHLNSSHFNSLTEDVQKYKYIEESLNKKFLYSFCQSNFTKIFWSAQRLIVEDICQKGATQKNEIPQNTVEK